MEELTKDFEILIIAWLKSGDENVTNLAHSLSEHALSKDTYKTESIELDIDNVGTRSINSIMIGDVEYKRVN